MYNKSLDTASIESMRKALAEVEMNESDRAKHYKGATPPEDMKNNRKGKGAQDMMKPADDAVANPAADEQDMVNKDAAKMTANVKVAKKRRNDKDVGDKDIVEPGTPMKDPAVVKPAVKESIGKTPGDKSYYNLQRAKELAKKAGHDYDKLPQYDRRHDKHKDYFDNKAKNESMDNKMFVLRKQAQANQRRIDKGMKPITPLHPDHKNLIKPMKKKKANEEIEMANIKPRWILDAYKSMYEDLNQKDVKTVKKVIKGLKGAVKTHAGQVKSLTKDIQDEDVKKVAGGVAKGKPGMKAYKAGKTPYQMRIKKITGKSKLDSPHMQPQKEDIE